MAGKKTAELKFPWKQYVRMLNQLGEAGTGKEMKKAMEKVVLEYEAEAVRLAPHDKGFLENSSTTRTKSYYGTGIISTVAFGAGYAAEVHELPPAARGPKTRAKPSTKFGSPGPKFLERVLKGMDFEHFIGVAFRQVLKDLAAKNKRKKKGKK